MKCISDMGDKPFPSILVFRSIDCLLLVHTGWSHLTFSVDITLRELDCYIIDRLGQDVSFSHIPKMPANLISDVMHSLPWQHHTDQICENWMFILKKLATSIIGKGHILLVGIYQLSTGLCSEIQHKVEMCTKWRSVT